ncbi:hypothetical protein CLCR_02458 [Cladophialophora carrionii]|uniref:Uncharacterized protein n=1 Tax=Cladophialophora carrionii TaxID=86049 RepID=A0A1C1CFS7_9EURO|nr:hypothetical protein CLCR_02458 [Cladophialophora carrionii]
MVVRETRLKLRAALWRTEQLMEVFFMLFPIFNFAQRLVLKCCKLDELRTKSSSIYAVVDETSNAREHNTPRPPMPGAYPTLAHEPRSEMESPVHASFAYLTLEHDQYCYERGVDDNNDKAGLNDGEGGSDQSRLGLIGTAGDYDEDTRRREPNDLPVQTPDASEYDADNESSSSNDSEQRFVKKFRGVPLKTAAAHAPRGRIKSNNGEFIEGWVDGSETADTHVQSTHDQTRSISLGSAACDSCDRRYDPSSRSVPLTSPPASPGAFISHRTVHERIQAWEERQRQRQQDQERNQPNGEHEPSWESIEKRARRWNTERMRRLDMEVKSTFQSPTNLPLAEILANIHHRLDDIDNSHPTGRVPDHPPTSASTTHPTTTSKSQGHQAANNIDDEGFRLWPVEERGRRNAYDWTNITCPLGSMPQSLEARSTKK